MGDDIAEAPPRRVAVPKIRVSQTVLEVDAELRQLAEKAEPQWLERLLQRAFQVAGWGVGGGRRC